MTEPLRIKHLRQILLWPVYLLPLDEKTPLEGHWEHLEQSGSPWREVDDEFGDPAEFQERHYNEFVTFLPPVQRFLYGQGLGRSVRSGYGESPIKVMRRADIDRVRVTIDKADEPVELSVIHADLYFFFDIDVVILALEIAADDIDFDLAQELLFRFGRAYPAYWEESGRGGHCPWKVEWLGREGQVLSVSDYEKRDKYLKFVCQHRAPAVAAHWEFLLEPLVLYHGDKKGAVRFRQLEYYRMPYMAFVGLDDPHALSRAGYVRLALGAAPGNGDGLPYSESYLEQFEDKYCYDRYVDQPGEGARTGARFMVTDHTLVVTGPARNSFFMDRNGGFLGRFRHQHFLLFLIAHFQKAALRMFSDRMVAMVSRLDLASAEANRRFRREIREALENFLRFEHRYWFHEISNQAQARELFEMSRRHLDLDGLYREVREELQDMGNFLEVEAARRQNETVVRLTVVTTFGLIGTVAGGLLGMNLIAWSEEPAPWRIGVFLGLLVAVAALTLYTVKKSKRLSDFLEVLADEQASAGDKLKAFARVWRRGG